MLEVQQEANNNLVQKLLEGDIHEHKKESGVVQELAGSFPNTLSLQLFQVAKGVEAFYVLP